MQICENLWATTLSHFPKMACHFTALANPDLELDLIPRNSYSDELMSKLAAPRFGAANNDRASGPSFVVGGMVPLFL